MKKAQTAQKRVGMQFRGGPLFAGVIRIHKTSSKWRFSYGKTEY